MGEREGKERGRGKEGKLRLWLLANVPVTRVNTTLK